MEIKVGRERYRQGRSGRGEAGAVEVKQKRYRRGKSDGDARREGAIVKGQYDQGRQVLRSRRRQ